MKYCLTGVATTPLPYRVHYLNRGRVFLGRYLARVGEWSIYLTVRVLQYRWNIKSYELKLVSSRTVGANLKTHKS